MLKRIITAAVGLALFAAVLAAPSRVLTIAIAAVILCMLHEYYGASKADTAMKIVGFISALMLMAAMYAINVSQSMGYIVMVYVAAAAILLLYMALTVFKHGKRHYRDILSSGFMTAYITVSMWCVSFAADFYGKDMMLIVFVCAWCCDTFAYFTGRAVGKHKLIPHVSPNKTVEGSIGGVLGAMVCCIIYLCLSQKIVNGATIGHWLPLYALYGAIFGLVGGVFSQLGDLAASAIKRDEDIKDFGRIFPGHGGFLDRFDSVMYIAPLILILEVLLHL